MISVDNTQITLESNRKYFSFLETCILKSKKLIIKRALAKRAIQLAVWSSTGRYCSPIIEDVYLEMASKIHSPVKRSFDKDSTLHVVTECYGVGGHTKVVERWLSICDNNEKHSIVFTNQKLKMVPHDFFELIRDKNGEVISLSDIKFISSKAKRLRTLASGYERVVLHTHMHDVVPLIAFGTEEFTRPIILFNHADHLFWLGASIADLVAETRQWGKMFSQKYRNINGSMVLSIPPSNNLNRYDNSVQVGNVLSDCVRILTVGTAHKYIEINENNLTLYMRSVLTKYSNTEFVLVGPKKEQFPQWARLVDEYPGRVFILGPKSNSELHELMLSSDLVIDSFPMSGGTALGEAVCLGVPVLAFRSVTGHLDYTYNSESYCDTFGEFLLKTERFISEPEYRSVLSSDIYRCFSESEDIDKWRARLNNIINSLPERHRVKKIGQQTIYCFNELDKFILKAAESKKLILNIFNIIGIFHYRKRGLLRFSIGRIT
ncbi:glycosyltransferase family 1 protein [Vibrio cholerae]|nr:hypothetical protein GJ26_10800 [Vibrio cholerae]